MKLLRLCAIIVPLISYSCGTTDDALSDEKSNRPSATVVVNPVTALKAEETENANELNVTWKNPDDNQLVRVEIAYRLKENNVTGDNTLQYLKVYPGEESSLLLDLPVYGEYEIAVVALDNYNRRSPEETVSATPSKNGYDWAALADSCTYVLTEQFLNKSKGTFWITPKDVSGNSWNIYWQQAHAMDVLVYSYERIKEDNPTLADTYKQYFKLWYDNKANNYNHDSKDATGFLNNFTDDMCWICLTLIHMSEATGDLTYLNTAKEVYDQYIITRAWSDAKGTGLPWKGDDKGRNACTNAPGCLVAAKLYKHFSEEKYLTDSKTLYDYAANNLLKEDGRIEEPPLTYTQGTFGEACRQLYHLTGEKAYMRMAEKVINYTITSDRCLNNGILRDEGTSADQSIFKAVFVPYAVNLALDDKAISSIRVSIQTFLETNAKALRNHLDRSVYPEMYCNYYWGKTFSGSIASMGAQASGASLMEGVARMKKELASGKQ